MDAIENQLGVTLALPAMYEAAILSVVGGLGGGEGEALGAHHALGSHHPGAVEDPHAGGARGADLG